MQSKISVKLLQKLGACSSGVEEFASQKERNTMKVLNLLVKKEKWDYFSWLAPRLMTHKQKVQWSIFCAERVINVFEKQFPNDKRPREAIEAAKKWAKKPSRENAKAAYACAKAAYACDYAAYSCAYAAYACAYAAYASAYAADYAANASAYAADYAACYAASQTAMRKACANKAIQILSKK